MVSIIFLYKILGLDKRCHSLSLNFFFTSFVTLYDVKPKLSCVDCTYGNTDMFIAPI